MSEHSEAIEPSWRVCLERVYISNTSLTNAEESLNVAMHYLLINANVFSTFLMNR